MAPVLVTYPAGIVAHCRHVHLRNPDGTPQLGSTSIAPKVTHVSFD